MIRIIVRSKRDADAIKAVIERFYEEWNISVHTLKGARNVNKALDVLEEFRKKPEFIIIILGREDKDSATILESMLPYNFIVHVIPYAKVRNARIDHLFHELETAKSKIRLTITWDCADNVFLLYKGGESLEDLKINPAFEAFFGLGEKVKHYLSKVIRGAIGLNPLLVREFSGLHKVYCGPKRTAALKMPDKGTTPEGKIISDEIYDVDLNKLIKANKQILNLYESIALEFLKRFEKWADTVIIPWSGGKDSTTVLLLALKVFSKKKVIPIYADTGLEFPWTKEYIEQTSRRLGLRVHITYVRLDEELKKGRELPTHDNRWCTGLKIHAVEKAISELSHGNTLIIVGDRDAESERRSKRPPIRSVTGHKLVVAPIKLWGATHTQLYPLLNNIPLNPLYNIGFYRIGCYICPALRSWEVYLMLEDKELKASLVSQPFYKEFIEFREKTQVLE